MKLFSDVANDLRAALRGLRRGGELPLVVALTLALGIGANLTIFSASRALVDGALPYPEAHRLVHLTLRGSEGRSESPRLEDFLAWRSAASPAASIAAVAPRGMTLGDGSGTTRVAGARATADYFAVLGVEPLLGRAFTEEEAGRGTPVAVISHRLREGRFGGDRTVLGRSIDLDGESHTIVGVLPAGTGYPAGPDLWVPLAAGAEEAASLRPTVIGRLRGDASAGRLEEALAGVQAALDASRPAEERSAGVRARSLVERETANPRRGVLVFRVAAALVLLLACANAAGLMLVRSAAREREVAVRRALGASPGRVARTVLAEGLLLALGAGALGTLLAHLSVRSLRLALPPFFARNVLGWERLSLDLSGLAFALGASLATGLAFSLPSMLRAARASPAESLKEGSPGASTGRGRARATRFWVAGEVAVSLVLLVAAGLLARSLLARVTADPGFRAEGILTVRWAAPPDLGDDPAALVALQGALVERVAAVPGAGRAEVASNLPMSLTGWSKEYRTEGEEEEARGSWRPVSPGYLDLLSIPLRRGRPLRDSDGPGAPRVVVVSERLAERHWPGGDPLGEVVLVEGERWTVVGVAGDVHDYGVEDAPEPTLYVPQRQAPTAAGFLAVPVEGDAGALAARVREEIWRLDPDIVLEEVRTMEGMVSDFYAMDRLAPILLGVFASVSLLITLVSLYTAVSYGVTRRRREIGIRLALGARPERILRRTVWQGLSPAAAGTAVGLLLAFGAARLLAGMLYGVAATDALVFTLVPAGLLLAAAGACLVPARRAAATDPTALLRGE